MESTTAGHGKKSTTRKRKAKPRTTAKRTRRAQPKSQDASAFSSIDTREKAVYLVTALGVAAVAATARGRKILGSVGKFAAPIAISILQPKVESLIQSMIKAQFTRSKT